MHYSFGDPRLKAVVLDSSEDESFFSVRADTLGRLFVGGREALFLYELKADGGYQPRRLLYRFPKDTWVNDIAIRGDDLYVATVSAIYRLPGAAATDVAKVKPERILWGVPLGHVHQCFHALAWGPDGDLYISMGDPVTSYGDFNRPDHWVHWTMFNQAAGQPEPITTPYNGVGGVFRLRPDGSRFQVVAGGLRNACGLAFDRDWNLFTNDNDHESLPAQYVPGRLLYVVPHAYFSWPRGWDPTKTPGRADLLDTVVEGLGRFVPVGQSYYDDTYLPADYRNNLLVARWCTGAVTRYPLERRRASFRAREQGLVQGRDDARPVGVSVGRGGRIFVTVAQMAQNEGSPIYRSDLLMITRADDSPAAAFRSYDVRKLAGDALLDALKADDLSRRQVAHEELLRRGGKTLSAATDRLLAGHTAGAEQAHLVWLAGAEGSKAAADYLLKLAADKESRPELRVAALRALTEYPKLGASEAAFNAAAVDRRPPVALAGLEGLFRFAGPVDSAVIAGPASGDDSYLRQIATMLLAERAPLEQLQLLCHSSADGERLAGVLALGFRLTMPKTSGAISPGKKLDALPSPSAYEIQYADAKVDLRRLGPVGNYTMADHWRQAKPSDDEQRLFAALTPMLGDRAESVRLQAAFFLSLLNDPRSEPDVERVNRASDETRLARAKASSVNRAWLVGPFADGAAGFKRVHPPEQGAIDLAATYASGNSATLAWTEVRTKRRFELGPELTRAEQASWYAYFQLQSATRSPTQLLLGSNDGVRAWHNGKLVWTNDVERTALPIQDVIPLELEPGTNDILIRVRNRVGASDLYINYRTLGTVVAALPEKLGIAGLAQRLASAAGGRAAISPEFAHVDWNQAAAAGDASRGRKLFEAIGCAKCHAVNASSAGTGGPSLADARRRFTVAHLVESILLPSKQISPIFRATQVLTSDGRQLSGLVVGETAEKVELLQSDTKRVDIRKSDIELRKLLDTSPMPQGVVKTPTELGDLLAFLLSPESSR